MAEEIHLIVSDGLGREGMAQMMSRLRPVTSHGPKATRPGLHTRPSSTFFIRRRQRILGTEYWTGKAWSTYPCFARPYSLVDGIGVVQKRFRRHVPKPMLVSTRDVHDR